MTVGEIVWYAGPSAPDGWLVCDGAFVSQSTYAALFALLGHSYNGGTDPGDGTFKVPDHRGVMLLGQAVSGNGHTRGSAGGNSPHTHAGPSHTHGVTQPDAHGSHTIGQPNDHSLTHSGLAVDDHPSQAHAFTVATHIVAQPGAHGTHSSVGGHTHGAHTQGSTFLNTSSSNYLQGATHASGGAHTHDAHSVHVNQAASVHSLTQPTDHGAQANTVTQASAHTALSHSSAGLDAHSAHSGFATQAGGTAASGNGDPPTLTLNALVATE